MGDVIELRPGALGRQVMVEREGLRGHVAELSADVERLRSVIRALMAENMMLKESLRGRRGGRQGGWGYAPFWDSDRRGSNPIKDT